MSEDISLCVAQLSSAAGEDLAEKWDRFRARQGSTGAWNIAPPGKSKSWFIVPACDDEDDDDEDVLFIEFVDKTDSTKVIASLELDVVMDKSLEPNLKDFKVSSGIKAKLCFLSGKASVPIPTMPEEKKQEEKHSTPPPPPPQAQPLQEKPATPASEEKPVSMSTLQGDSSPPRTEPVTSPEKPPTSVAEKPAPPATLSQSTPANNSTAEPSPTTQQPRAVSATSTATTAAPPKPTAPPSSTPAPATQTETAVPRSGAAYTLLIHVLSVKGLFVGGTRPPDTLVRVETQESFAETSVVKNSNDPQYNSKVTLYGSQVNTLTNGSGKTTELVFRVLEKRLMGNKPICSAAVKVNFHESALPKINGSSVKVRVTIPQEKSPAGHPAELTARITLWDPSVLEEVTADRQKRLHKPLPKAEFLQLELVSALYPQKVSKEGGDNCSYQVLAVRMEEGPDGNKTPDLRVVVPKDEEANSKVWNIKSDKVLNAYGEPKWLQKLLIPIGFELQEVNLIMNVNSRSAATNVFSFEVPAAQGPKHRPSWLTEELRNGENTLKLRWRSGTQEQLEATNATDRKEASEPLRTADNGGRYFTFTVEGAENTIPFNGGMSELHLMLSHRGNEMSCMTLQRGEVTDIGDPYQNFATSTLEQMVLQIKCPTEPDVVLGEAFVNIPCNTDASGSDGPRWVTLQPREDPKLRSKDVKILNQYGLGSVGQTHFGRISYSWAVQTLPPVEEGRQACVQIESILFPDDEGDDHAHGEAQHPLFVAFSGVEETVKVERNWTGAPGLFIPISVADQPSVQKLNLTLQYKSELLQYDLHPNVTGQRILVHAGFGQGNTPIHISLLWVQGYSPIASCDAASGDDAVVDVQGNDIRGQQSQINPHAAPSPFSWLANINWTAQPSSKSIIKLNSQKLGFQPVIAMDVPTTSVISNTPFSKEEFEIDLGGSSSSPPVLVKMDSLEETGTVTLSNTADLQWFHGNVGRTIQEEMAYRREEEAGERAAVEDDGEVHMVRFVLQTTGAKQWEPRLTCGSTCTTLGQTGKVMLVGGMNEVGVLEPTASSYTALTKQWTLVGEHPLLARHQHSAVFHQGQVVVHAGIGFGGFDPTCVGDDGYQVPQSARMKQVQNAKKRGTTPQQRLASKMTNPASVGFLADTVFFDPKTGELETLDYRAPETAGGNRSVAARGESARVDQGEPVVAGSAAPPPRAHHSTILLRDHLFIFGGWTVIIEEHQWSQGSFYRPAEVLSERLVKVNLLDGTVHDVIERGTLPSLRADHVAVEHNGKMWVHGGVDATGLALNDIFVFNCASSVWQEVLSLGPVKSPSLFGHSATVKDGLVTVVGSGGRSGAGGAHAFEFDLETNFWRRLSFDLCSLDGDRYGNAMAHTAARPAEKRQKKLMPSETIPLLEMVVVGGLKKRPTPASLIEQSKCTQAPSLCSKTCLVHVGKDISESPVQLSTAAQIRIARAAAKRGTEEDPVLNLKSMTRGGDSLEKTANRLSRPKTAPGSRDAGHAKAGGDKDKNKLQKLSADRQEAMADRLSRRPPSAAEKFEAEQKLRAPKRKVLSNPEQHLKRVYDDAKNKREEARQLPESADPGKQLSPTAIRHSNQRQYYSVLENRKKNQMELHKKYNPAQKVAARDEGSWGETVSRLHPRPPSPLSSQRK